MGIFDKLKKDAEDKTQNDQNEQGNQPADQFGGGQSGQDMQTAQNVIGQQGGYQDQDQQGGDDQDQDENQNQDQN